MSSNLQHKLSKYEAAPPVHVWDNIAAALDEKEGSLEDRLYHYQQQPPAQVWDKLEEALDNVSPAKTLPLKSFNKIFRYATAAAVIIFIAIGSTYYFGATHKAAGIAIQPLQKKVAPAPAQNTIVAITDTTDIKQVAQFKKQVPVQNVKQSRYFPINIAKAVKLPVKRALTKPSLPAFVAVSNHSFQAPKTERYMIATVNDGTAIRLPKKVYTSFACAGMFVEINCKEKLQAVQQKIMNTSLATDFTGLIDLLHNLQDNQ